MKTKLHIIKIGGNIIDSPKLLADFLVDFSVLKEPKILIHGGGILASKLNEKLGIKTIMNEGRRITSKENLEVVTMVYAGLINKTITASLQADNCNAIGLCGADVNLISSYKRSPKPIDFGYVGDVKKVNVKAIELFLANHITPVLCAITHDTNGQLLNTNADTIASEIAIAMSNNYKTELIYCFDKKGVLADLENPNSIIPTINTDIYEELKKNKTIHTGMLPKLDNCFHALNKNVEKVMIGNYQVLQFKNNQHTSITL